MYILYCSADIYDTYTKNNPADVRWDVLNHTMSQYNLHYNHILWLNCVGLNHAGFIQKYVSGVKTFTNKCGSWDSTKGCPRVLDWGQVCVKQVSLWEILL